MAKDLLLPSLQVSNFRPFRRLVIPRVGRLNLVVGKNNVGKSSLLEALRLYAERGQPALIWRLLEEREETLIPTRANENVALLDESGYAEVLEDLLYLFHGRNAFPNLPNPISIGPCSQPIEAFEVSSDTTVASPKKADPCGQSTETLEVGLEWRNVAEQQRRLPLFAEEARVLTLQVSFGGRSMFAVDIDAAASRLRAEFGYRSVPDRYNPLRRAVGPLSEVREVQSVFVGANGLSRSMVARLWDSITLTGLENDVVQALRIIAPEVERLSLVGEREGAANRIPIVKIRDVETPISLRSLGEGMNRMFGIALALVNARGGLLLIDEIESGLHYSVQRDMWKLLFQMARRLDVQVFATTHSGDCLEAFGKVAADDRRTEGVLVRLGRRDADIVATPYDETELGIVTREQIEVR